MDDSPAQSTTYSRVNDRLKEIVELVGNDDLSLDEALELFEEAVKLGMQASDMLEQDIAERDATEAVDDTDRMAGSADSDSASQLV